MSNRYFPINVNCVQPILSILTKYRFSFNRSQSSLTLQAKLRRHCFCSFQSISFLACNNFSRYRHIYFTTSQTHTQKYIHTHYIYMYVCVWWGWMCVCTCSKHTSHFRNLFDVIPNPHPFFYPSVKLPKLFSPVSAAMIYVVKLLFH